MRRGTRAWEAAARSFGIDPQPRIRPGPLRWLWFAVWGPLPERYRLWILYDATCDTWVLRYFARILAIVTPLAVALAVVLPGHVGPRVLTAAVTAAFALFLTGVWVNEATEARLVRADWGWEIGAALREERAAFAQRLDDV